MYLFCRLRTCYSRHNRFIGHSVLIVDREEVHASGDVTTDDTDHVDAKPGDEEVRFLVNYGGLKVYLFLKRRKKIMFTQHSLSSIVIVIKSIKPHL